MKNTKLRNIILVLFALCILLFNTASLSDVNEKEQKCHNLQGSFFYPKAFTLKNGNVAVVSTSAGQTVMTTFDQNGNLVKEKVIFNSTYDENTQLLGTSKWYLGLFAELDKITPTVASTTEKKSDTPDQNTTEENEKGNQNTTENDTTESPNTKTINTTESLYTTEGNTTENDTENNSTKKNLRRNEEKNGFGEIILPIEENLGLSLYTPLSSASFDMRCYSALQNDNLMVSSLTKKDGKYSGSISYVKGQNVYKGDDFTSEDKQLSCFELQKDDVYCVYLSLDSDYISKLTLKKFDVKGDSTEEATGLKQTQKLDACNLNSTFEKTIKISHKGFTYSKAIALNDQEFAMIFETPNYTQLPVKVLDGQYLYFIKSKVSNGEYTSERYEYLYDQCHFDKNSSSYNPTLAALSDKRVVVVCATKENHLHFMVLTDGVKKITEFDLEDSVYSNPTFTKFGGSLGVVYTKEEGKTKRTALKILNFPDCTDLNPTGPIHKSLKLQLDSKVSNYYIKTVTGQSVSIQNIDPSLVLNNNNKVVNDSERFKAPVSLTVNPEEKSGNYTFYYTSILQDSVDGEVVGKTCKVVVNVPECFSGCYSCWATAATNNHYCLDKCLAGYYRDNVTNNLAGFNKDDYGEYFNCPKCEDGCLECNKGPETIEGIKYKNCLPKKCNNTAGYYYVGDSDINCLNESEMILYGQTKKQKYRKSQDQEGVYYWEKYVCHENCEDCYVKGDNNNNMCTICKEGYHFLYNQSENSTCYTGFEGKGFYLNITDDKYYPCSSNCLECDDDVTCTKCNLETYLFNKACVSVCDKHYAYDKVNRACVNCKDTSSYNFKQTCINYIPEGYHVYDFNFSILIKCDNESRCFECKPENTSKCTQCYSDKYKEHFNDNRETFNCYTGSECENYGGVLNRDMNLNLSFCQNCKLQSLYRDVNKKKCVSSQTNTTFVSIVEYNALELCINGNSIKYCEYCDNKNTCNGCTQGYAFTKDNTTYCFNIDVELKEYYPAPFAFPPTYYPCTDVNDTCRTCSNSTYCTSCFDKYGLYYNHSFCVEIDKQEHYRNRTDGLYYQCDNDFNNLTGCETCNNQTYCTKCKKGYGLLKENHTCVIKELIGVDHYYNKTEDIYILCSWNIDGCINCTDDGEKCNKCDHHDYIEYNYTCIAPPNPIDFFYYDYIENIYKYCFEGIPNCHLCYYQNSTDLKMTLACDTCYDKYTIVNDTLFCEDESKYKNNKEYFTVNKGKNYYSCHYGVSNCYLCDVNNENTSKALAFNDVYCDQCKETFTIHNKENKKCPNAEIYKNEHHFTNDSGIHYYDCDYGVKNCDSCFSGKACKQCFVDHTIFNDEVGVCYDKSLYYDNDSYYTNDTGYHYFYCNHDVGNCRTCYRGDYCKKCYDLFTIFNDEVEKCYDKSPYPYNDSYYTNDTGYHYYYCNQGPLAVNDCKTCYKGKYCKQCYDSFTIFNDEVEKCYDKSQYELNLSYYSNDTGYHYFPCDHNVEHCKTCYSGNYCKQCESSFAIINDNVELCEDVIIYQYNDSYYTNDTGSHYFYCDNGPLAVDKCRTCYSGKNCKKCYGGFAKYNGNNTVCKDESIYKEKDTYYYYEEENSYYDCDKGPLGVDKCSKCSAGSYCTQCSSGFVIYNGNASACVEKSQFENKTTIYGNVTHYFDCHQGPKGVKNCETCPFEGGVCDKCKNGFTIYNDITTECTNEDNFKNESYYYYSYHYYDCNKGPEGVKNCSTCLGGNHCKQCENTFVIYNDDFKVCHKKSSFEIDVYYSNDDGHHYYDCDKGELGVNNCSHCYTSREVGKACKQCSSQFTIFSNEVYECKDKSYYQGNDTFFTNDSEIHYYYCSQGLVGNCFRCSSQSVCKQCQNDYCFVDDDFGKCYEEYEYKNNTNYFYEESKYCYYSCSKYNKVENCQKCKDRNTCNICMNAYTFKNRQKRTCYEIDTLVPYYYPDPDDETDYLSCEDYNDVSYCLKCNNQAVCDECLEKRFLFNNMCRKDTGLAIYIEQVQIINGEFIIFGSSSQELSTITFLIEIQVHITIIITSYTEIRSVRREGRDVVFTSKYDSISGEVLALTNTTLIEELRNYTLEGEVNITLDKIEEAETDLNVLLTNDSRYLDAYQVSQLIQQGLISNYSDLVVKPEPSCQKMVIIIVQIQIINNQCDIFATSSIDLSIASCNCVIKAQITLTVTSSSGLRKLEEKQEEVYFTVKNEQMTGNVVKFSSNELNEEIKEQSKNGDVDVKLNKVSYQSTEVELPSNTDLLDAEKTKEKIANGDVTDYSKKEGDKMEVDLYHVTSSTQGCQFNLGLNSTVTNLSKNFDMVLVNTENTNEKVTAHCKLEINTNTVPCSLDKSAQGTYQIDNPVIADSADVIYLKPDNNITVSCDVSTPTTPTTNTTTTPTTPTPTPPYSGSGGGYSSNGSSSSNTGLIVGLVIVGVIVVIGVIVAIVLIRRGKLNNIVEQQESSVVTANAGYTSPGEVIKS